jgi:hypothetical protein
MKLIGPFHRLDAAALVEGVTVVVADACQQAAGRLAGTAAHQGLVGEDLAAL